PVPARFIIGATIAFAGLGGVGIVVYVWIRCWTKSDDDDGGRKARDLESRLTGGTRVDGDVDGDGARKEMVVEPVEEVGAVGQGQPVEQDHQQRRADWVHRPEHRDGVEPPVEAYRGHAKTYQPRRGSVELSAIQERSRESDGGHPGHQECARRPYRSPSVASVPESLMPGRRETPKPETPTHTHWGPVMSPLPQVPVPLRFGRSIIGHDGFLEEHHGSGRRLQKARGRNVR
ncbi:MAG: hypothetical protein M1830_000757, partial [Pleopsidium flavum]